MNTLDQSFPGDPSEDRQAIGYAYKLKQGAQMAQACVRAYARLSALLTYAEQDALGLSVSYYMRDVWSVAAGICARCDSCHKHLRHGTAGRPLQ